MSTANTTTKTQREFHAENRLADQTSWRRRCLYNVRLIAVHRPGWLQVFRFEAKARQQAPPSDGPDPIAEYAELYGLVREDVRKSMTNVRVFRDPDERRKLFEEWGENLLQLRGAQALGRR